MNCPSDFSVLLNPLYGLIKPQGKSEGLVPFAEAEGGLYLPGISLPASAFVCGLVKPRGFTLLLELFVWLSEIHPRSWAAERGPRPALQVPESGLTASAASSALIQGIVGTGDGHHCLLS